VKSGSNRSFGLVFAAVFLIIALFPLIGGREVRLWALLAALAFAGAAFLRPSLLAPLNRLWFRFGLLLHHVVNPLVLGLMYFLVVTPMGLVIRIFGGRLLSLGFSRDAQSYWIRRSPPGPEPESIRNQF
jgi:hypothetical protein